MVWNYTDKSELKMKNLSDNELKIYLSEIKANIIGLWCLSNRGWWLKFI